MSNAVTRCKVKVGSVMEYKKPETNEKYQEQISIHGVYSDDPNSENKQWAKWTPAFNLNMTIDNPGAFGRLKTGQEYYLDFIPVEPVEPEAA